MKCRIWSTSGNFSNRVDVEGKILLRTVQAGNSGLKIAALNGVEQFFQNEAARFRHFNNHEVHMGVEPAVFPAGFISLPETETKCAHGGVPGGQPCLLGILQRLPLSPDGVCNAVAGVYKPGSASFPNRTIAPPWFYWPVVRCSDDLIF